MCSSSALMPGMSGVRAMKSDVGKCLVSLLEIRQDPLVADAGPLLVPLRDRQLVVVEHRVDVRQHLLYELPGHVARRFDGRVHAAVVGALQQRRAEVRLQQALAAAQRHPAAGVAVERAVLLHLVQHLVDGHAFPEHLERARRAERRQCLVAVSGQIPVDMDRVVGALDHIEGAFREGCLQAHAARRLAGALPGVVGKLGLEGDALGVAAPLAAERAALEEDVRADARAVVAAVALDVQDGSRQRG